MNPPRGDGEWARKSLIKEWFYYSGYNIKEMINQTFLGPYTGWNHVFLQFYKKKLRFFSEKGDPWGDLNAPETTSDSRFLLFMSDLIKESNQVRITYAQNHFKSTFGSAYFISKNNAVKLAKPAKKEPRKASFPWDLGLMFVQPIKGTDIAEY